MVALPKCPLCFVAIAGVLGAAGMSVWLPRVAIVLLAISVVLVAMRSRVDGVIAFVAAVAIAAGRFWLASTPLVIAGAATLIVIAIRRARIAATRCSDCVHINEIERV